MATDSSVEQAPTAWPGLEDPAEFARDAGIQLSRLLAYLGMTAIIGIVLDPVVPWAHIHPGVVFTNPIVLGGLLVGIVAVLLKPLRYDPVELNRFLSPGQGLRTAVLYGTFVSFLAFAMGVFGQPPGIGALPEVIATLFRVDLAAVGLAPLLVAVVLLAVVVLFSSHVSLLGIVGGGIVGAIAGLVGWQLSLDALLAGSLTGGMLGGLVASALLGLDPRQVDDGAIAAAVVVGVGLLLFAPNPALVFGWSAIAAGVVSGLHVLDDLPSRPTNALVAMREDRRVDTVPGFESMRRTQGDPVPPASVAAQVGLEYPLRRGWGVLVNLAVLLLVSPLLLFLPLFLWAGYLFRVLAAAGHGYEQPPAVRLGLGRRALFKEGLLGVLALTPLLLLVGWVLPPLLDTLPRLHIGDGILDFALVGATLVDWYGALGLPAPLVGEPPVAALLVGVALAAVPVVATNYAMTGCLRYAYDPRRVVSSVRDRRFLPYLGVQLGYVVLVPVAVTLAGAVGLFLAMVLGGIVGLLGGFVGLLVLIGCLAGLMLLPVGSAALWGLYGRGRG